jgi:membrane-associated phospholipid phosphatase
MIMAVITIAISRISLAMHYPADILYGAIIAYCVYLVSGYIYRLFEHNIIKWVKNRLV